MLAIAPISSNVVSLGHISTTGGSGTIRKEELFAMKDHEDDGRENTDSEEVAETGKGMDRRRFVLSATQAMSVAAALMGLGRRADAQGVPIGGQCRISGYSVYKGIGQNCSSFNCTSFACQGELLDDFECTSSFNCYSSYGCVCSFDDEDCEGSYSCWSTFDDEIAGCI